MLVLSKISDWWKETNCVAFGSGAKGVYVCAVNLWRSIFREDCPSTCVILHRSTLWCVYCSMILLQSCTHGLDGKGRGVPPRYTSLFLASDSAFCHLRPLTICAHNTLPLCKILDWRSLCAVRTVNTFRFIQSTETTAPSCTYWHFISVLLLFLSCYFSMVSHLFF